MYSVFNKVREFVVRDASETRGQRLSREADERLAKIRAKNEPKSRPVKRVESFRYWFEFMTEQYGGELRAKRRELARARMMNAIKSGKGKTI
jgi:hypothetical protein